MKIKQWIRLGIIVAVFAVAAYFILSKVNSDMDKKQQKMNESIKQLNRTSPY